jgi:sugar O-acyltransferase (sialic acid O-acetyltransferase NeuD family)
MTRLLVLGAGGHGKVVADCAQSSGHFASVEIYDDGRPAGTAVGRWRVAGNKNNLITGAGLADAAIVGIGDARIRMALLAELERHGVSLATVVHRDAVISDGVLLGAGTVVMAGAVINIDTTVGRGCIINTRSSVDHDCVLDDGVQVCPGATVAGRVTIGARTWVGVGSTIRDGVHLGADVFVGAGAVVVRSVADGTKVLGVPARPVQT